MKINVKGLDAKQSAALKKLTRQLDFELSEEGTAVEVKRGEKLCVSYNNGNAKITYARDCELWRGFSMLKRVVENKTEMAAESDYDMLCYMADMSRNAVFNLSAARRMIRYLALMGYDSLMLYTEDTYENPDYPYFGYMRGRFSKEELREIDDYADLFGIEVIPCIQTLAHLNAALHWPGLSSIRDIGDILLAGDENTYKFIDSCLAICAECFRSRRINIGMDEAHMLGLGRYLSKNSYRPATEIMLEHLDRVVELCRNHGFAPMIWSDMFFRMAFNGAYRVREGEISQDVIDRVPDGLTLIYWDYYSLDRQIFSHMVDCHLKFKNPMIFAGGAWKWSGLAPHNRHSLASTEMQLDVCAECGCKNIIVTAWGDDGGEASQFSVLPAMLYFAERRYKKGHPDNDELEARSRECFGIGYEELLTLDAPNELPGITIDLGHPMNPSKYLLWNDPLEGLMDSNFDHETAPDGFMKSAQRLLLNSDHPQFGYIFLTLGELCLLLAQKCDLSVRIREAYRTGERVQLAYIADEEITEITEQLTVFKDAFRKQWNIENKPYGFSVQEIRIGALRERLNSTAARIMDYLAGDIDRIPELEEEHLPFDGKKPEDRKTPYINCNVWSSEVTGCVLG